MKKQMMKAMHFENKDLVTNKFEANYISLNPSYYDTYFMLGRYYAHFWKIHRAIAFYQLALTKGPSCISEKNP